MGLHVTPAAAKLRRDLTAGAVRYQGANDNYRVETGERLTCYRSAYGFISISTNSIG
jgi:hypothetical protein